MGYYLLVLSAVLGSDDANPFINAFTYESTEILPTSEGAGVLADQFLSEVLGDGTPLRALLPPEIVFQSITVTAPQVPTVLSVDAISEAGEGAGDHGGAWTIYEWWSPRTLATIRPGFKRFGPVIKANNEDGVISSAALTVANNVSTQLSLILEGDVGGIATLFTPIIVKRIPYETEGGNTAYRLPGAGDPFVRSVATNWAYKRLSTQSSRKR